MELIIHKDRILFFDGNDEDCTVRLVGVAVQVEDFTEIHIKDKYFFKKAIERIGSDED
jgi:hypothetical protein